MMARAHMAKLRHHARAARRGGGQEPRTTGRRTRTPSSSRRSRVEQVLGSVMVADPLQHPRLLADHRRRGRALLVPLEMARRSSRRKPVRVIAGIGQAIGHDRPAPAQGHDRPRVHRRGRAEGLRWRASRPRGHQLRRGPRLLHDRRDHGASRRSASSRRARAARPSRPARPRSAAGSRSTPAAA